MTSDMLEARWNEKEGDRHSRTGSTEEEGVSFDTDEDEEQEPKFAQYLDSDEAAEEDDEDEAESESDDGEDGDGEVASIGETSEGNAIAKEKGLLRKMESIPFSSLLRARKTMREIDEDNSDSEEDEFEEARIERREVKDKSNRSLQALEKRDNKHAPTEMSSKKPVSRRRAVVETQNNASRRDPRFSSLSASLPNSGLYQSSYGFLREKQSLEVKELKSVFNKLKKQEANHAGPKAKSEAAQNIRKEKEEVEMALRRAEGRENERRKRERESEVIKREKKLIQDRVKAGGKQFHLKDSAKKQLILQDKFDRLSGGGKEIDGDASTKKDLKRAIERRRKKNAAKERREMPLGGGGGGGGTAFQSNGIVDIPKRKRMNADATLGDHSKPQRKRGRRG